MTLTIISLMIRSFRCICSAKEEAKIKRRKKRRKRDPDAQVLRSGIFKYMNVFYVLKVANFDTG